GNEDTIQHGFTLNGVGHPGVQQEAAPETQVPLRLTDGERQKVTDAINGLNGIAWDYQGAQPHERDQAVAAVLTNFNVLDPEKDDTSGLALIGLVTAGAMNDISFVASAFDIAEHTEQFSAEDMYNLRDTAGRVYEHEHVHGMSRAEAVQVVTTSVIGYLAGLDHTQRPRSAAAFEAL